MNFFRSDAEIQRRKELEDRAAHVRRGGSIQAFKPEDVLDLQEFALDIKDTRLYDHLETFWAGRKPSNVVRS